MLLGFSDQNAFDRVMSDAHAHFRRVSSTFALERVLASEPLEGAHFAVAWLAHGSLRFGRLAYNGIKPVTPSTTIGGRRCLVPFADGDRGTLLAAVWTPFKNDIQPQNFQLVQVDDQWIEVSPDNWDNWLNPERDVRPMLRRSDHLVVPGH